MRTGKWWMGASLGVALLLGSYGLRAQPPERIGLPGRSGPVSSGGVPAPQTGLPTVGSEAGTGHTTHEVDHHNGGEDESEGEGGSSGGLYGNFDFLLVRPRRSPHDIAIQDPNGNDAAVQGPVAHFDWETVGAYRIGAGYRMHNDWEIGGVYTYVHSKDDQTLGRPAGTALYANLSAPFVFDSVDGVRGSSNLNFDTVDIEIAKTWCPCDGLYLRLVGGGKVANIEQKMAVAYDFTSVGLGLSIVGEHIEFDGIGPRVGGEAWWCMHGGWGFYAKAFSSLMVGEYRTHLGQTVNGGRLVAIDVSDKFEKVVPVTELGIGLGWRSNNMSFLIGYELQNFFGMIDTIDFPSGTSFKPFYRTGDLSLEALTASLGFHF